MGEEAAGRHDPFGIVGTVQAKVFQVQKAVAEGGFGVVYKAHHEVFRSPVALKCLKLPEGLSDKQQESFLERFRSEAELLFRLSAALPEVVRPLQFGVLEARTFVPFLALEWLEGQTLDQYVADRTTAGKPAASVTSALEILAPVARVLARAHQFTDKGRDIAIIHRDVKPENVFLADVDGERVTRILDFGIARVKLETNAIAGSVTGGDLLNAFSPAYAAPEQWSPQTYGATGPWTDVYGLAITLTEVLIGRAPIQGDITAMMGAALDPEWRPTPRNKGAKVTDAVEKAFQKALAVDPRVRTQTIEGFWTQLELAAGKSPSITKRIGTTSALLGSTPPPPPDLELALPVAAPPPAPAPTPAPAPSSGGRAAAPAAQLAAPRFDDAPAGLGGGASLDIDVGAPVRAPTRPRPTREGAMGPGGLHPGMWRPEEPSKSLGARIGGASWIIVLALAIGGADIVAKQVTGQQLALGPVRPLYVAGPLAVLGLALLLYRLIED